MSTTQKDFLKLASKYNFNINQKISALSVIINFYCVLHRLDIIDTQKCARTISDLVNLKYEHVPF